jgi:tetratricopeptide (TPR) repeat protein
MERDFLPLLVISFVLVVLVAIPLVAWVFRGKRATARIRTGRPDLDELRLRDRGLARQRSLGSAWILLVFVCGVGLLAWRFTTPADRNFDREARDHPIRPGSLSLVPVLLIGALPVIVISIIAFLTLRHYDRDVNRVARRANEGDLDGAIDELRRQIEVKGLSASKANLLGCLLVNRKDWNGARHMFDEAERLGMNADLLRANRAMASWKSGELEEALRLLTEGALVKPGDVTTRCNLCLLLAEMGRTDEARNQLERIEVLHKDTYFIPATARQTVARLVQSCRERLASDPSQAGRGQA